MRIRAREAWLLVACVIAFFYRPLTTATFFFRDLYQLFYPKKLLLVAAIRAGELPLWDPSIHAGQPYLAMPSNAFFQPSNILYLFLPAIWAFNVAIVLQFMLCAIGAWWLARLLGLSPAAAFTCGTVFAFCGYTLSAANLLLIFSLPAFPFAIALIHLAIRGHRNALIGAACAIALPLLSGGAEAAAMLIVTVIAWALAMNASRAARPLIIAIVFGIGLSLIAIVPATEVIRNSSRSQFRPFESFAAWSVDPRRLPELVIPRFLGDTGKLDDRAYWGAQLESEQFPYMLSIYFGALTLILAGLGAIAPRDHIPRGTLAVLALLGIVLSLGKWLPLLRLLYLEFPIIGTFRFPVKAIEISLLPIALLAGCGIEALRKSVLGVAGAIFTVLAALFSLSASFADALSRAFFLQPISPLIHHELSRSMWHAAIVLILATLVVALRRPQILAAIVLVDLGLAGMNVNAFAPRAIFSEPAIAPRIRTLVGNGHFYRAPDVDALQLRAPSDDIMWLARWKLETLDGYSAATFGVPVVFSADYDGLAPRAIAYLTDVVQRAPWSSRIALLRAAGVRAFIAPDIVREPGIIQVATLRTAEAHPLYVYSIGDASPANFKGDCPASVALIRRTFNTSQWSFDGSCPGYMSFDESFYPGWKVFIDGRPRTLVGANGAFSAVFVPKGQHTIVKRYEPRLPLYGAIASFIALAGLIAASRAGSSVQP